MTTIKLKRSSSQGVTPGTEDLELGELAVNTYDGKLFLKKNDGSDSIVEFVPAQDTTQSIVFNDSEDFSRSALNIDYNVSGDTPALTGDILKRGLNIDVDSTANMGDTTNEHRLYGAYIDARATGDSNVVTGVRAYAESEHSAGTITNTIGLETRTVAGATGTGATTNLYGQYAIVDHLSANSVSNIAGFKTLVTASNAGAGGGTTIYGADIEVQRNGGSYTDAYGVKILLDDNNSDSAAPAITNSYLLYASYEGPTMATNEWGLYLPDTGTTNFIGGDLQLGTSADLQIQSTTSSTSPTTGALTVAGGAGFNGWVFFNIAGQNVVYDSDASDRQVFDIRRSNNNEWLLTLQSDGDLAFTNNATNNANGRVLIESSLIVDEVASIEGIEIGLAGGSTTATNLAIGAPSGVGRPLEQFTSANNIAIGYEASENNVDGYECVAIGRGALQDNVNQVRHVAIGHQALRDSGTGGGTSAGGNVAIGWQASVANTTGTNNVAVGYAALTGNTDGSQNTAVGYRALDTAGIGNDNTGVGHNALIALSSGAQNTVVGSGAATTLTGGSNNTVLGYNAEPSSATASNEITLGDTLVTGFRVPGVDIYADSTGVGIGTSSPARPFHVSAGTGTIPTVSGLGLIALIQNNSATSGSSGIGILSGNAADGSIYFGDAEDADIGSIIYEHATNDMVFTTNTVERMHIDSDGNVGIGSTDPDKTLVVQGAGAEVVINDTDTTDTPRLRLRESGTTSGTVYTDASSMYFSTGSTDRVRIASSDGRMIVPGGIQLGTADFTLSNANTFEDYEEGTWTPSYFMSTTDFTSITMDVVSATYTKIGDIVMIQGWIRTDDVDATGVAGQLRVSGLPFAISGYGAIAVGRSEGWTTNIWHAQLVGGETDIRLYKRTTISGQDNIMTAADMITGTSANRNNFIFAGQYRTTA